MASEEQNLRSGRFGFFPVDTWVTSKIWDVKIKKRAYNGSDSSYIRLVNREVGFFFIGWMFDHIIWH